LLGFFLELWVWESKKRFNRLPGTKKEANIDRERVGFSEIVKRIGDLAFDIMDKPKDGNVG